MDILPIPSDAEPTQSPDRGEAGMACGHGVDPALLVDDAVRNAAFERRVEVVRIALARLAADLGIRAGQ